MINISELFIKTYEEYVRKHKSKKHESHSKYKMQDLFISLHNFVSNCSYFSKYDGIIKGKYLNEIHNFLSKGSFYDILYKKIMDTYLEITELKTLEELSFDSSFTRNILGHEIHDRNPHYNNKPGMKMQVMVDKLRVPISFFCTTCSENDSLSVIKLFEESFINVNVLRENTSTILCDSGYESLSNNHYITENGFEIYEGYNKRNNKKHPTHKQASDENIFKYKKRGVVEMRTFLQIYKDILSYLIIMKVLHDHIKD